MLMPKLPKGPIIATPDLIPNVSEIYRRDIVNSMNNTTEEINKSLEKMSEEREKRYRDGVTREERMIELLESIDRNTSVLNDLLVVLQENTENQEVILDIINQFNSLATKNNKDEAKSLYRKIIDKINQSLTDANTINTLFLYGLTIYNSIMK